MKNYRKAAKYALIAFLIIMAALAFFSSTINNLGVTRVEAFNVTSGTLVWEYTAEGFIQAEEDITLRFGQAQAMRVTEIHVKEGETAEKGTPLISFDTSETERAIAELRRQEAMLDLEGEIAEADKTAAAERVIEAARDTVNKRRAELDKAREEAGFDGYIYEQATEDAGILLDRRLSELREAEEALAAARAAEPEAFDDWVYRQAARDAAIQLKRQEEAQKDAETALEEAQTKKPPDFDDYPYQNALDAAKTAYNRLYDDYYAALRQYDTAVYRYYELVLQDAESALIEAAKQASESAEAAVTAAERALSDADTQLTRAINDLARAERAYNESSAESHEASVSDAERIVKQTQNAEQDARRAFDRAVTELERARTAFDKNAADIWEKDIENTEKNVRIAEEAAADAQRAYDRAAENAGRAEETAAQNAMDRITEAEAALREAQRALTRARTENADTSAEEQYQALRKAGITSEIERLSAIIEASAVIYAPYDIYIEKIHTEPNLTTQQGTPLITARAAETALAACFTMEDEQLKHALIGTSVTITSKTKAGVTTKGTIARIKKAETGVSAKDVIIEGAFDRLEAGEPVTMRFTHISPKYEFIVPAEAVHSEGSSAYVYVIKERSTSLGAENYLQSVKVTAEETDGNYTAISQGVFWTDSVVVKSSNPVFAGEKVRVAE